jgi:hypothetical protein|tara:strand:+ start:1721 stop:2008 length:288 start_codon:yes stop_codon:yes gene_type:complete
MNTIVNCKINGINLRITSNSIEVNNKTLQIELVKRLIDCRALTPIGKSVLPLFFNKYLRKYKISDVLFTEERPAIYLDPAFDDQYIDDIMDGIAA